MSAKPTRPPNPSSETFAYRGAEWHRKSTGTTGLLYDSDNVIADLDGSTVSRFYVTPMLDQNVSMTVTAGPDAVTYWYSQDERQSVRTLTDSAGAVVARYDYTAFGEPVACGPAAVVQQRYTYTGREINPYSGNFYFRFRTYAPGSGIFTARDPLGYVDGMGLYRGYYAERMRMDPYGLHLDLWPGWKLPIVQKEIWTLKESIVSLFDVRPCCAGVKYNPLTECCCNGTVFNRAEEETGVSYVESPINADWALVPSADHAWLEVGNDIGDLNPAVDMVNDVGVVEKNKLDPKYSTAKHKRFEDRASIKLSPCKHDTAKFVEELKQLLEKQLTNHSKWSFAPAICTLVTSEYSHNCQTWAGGLISLAKERSKRECK